MVPVTQRFPEAPGNVAMTPCPQLQKIAEDARLSDISKTITVNYGTYYECAVKTDAWIEWYQKQQQIFNNIKWTMVARKVIRKKIVPQPVPAATNKFPTAAIGLSMVILTNYQSEVKQALALLLKTLTWTYFINF